MNPPQNNNLDPNLFSGPFAAFGQTINGLKDKISQIQAQRVLNKNTIKDKLAELGRNIEEIVQQTTNKLRPLAARNAELTQQVQQQQGQLQQLQQQLQQLQQQTAQLQQQIQTLTQERDQISQQLQQAQQQLQQIPGLQQQIQDLNGQIAQKDQQIQQATQEMDDITQKIGQVNVALTTEIDKLNDLIGNVSNQEIMDIINQLQARLGEIINSFNSTTISGGKRHRRKTNKRQTNKRYLKGGYTYASSKSLDSASSVISRRTRRRHNTGSKTGSRTITSASRRSTDSFFGKRRTRSK